MIITIFMALLTGSQATNNWYYGDPCANWTAAECKAKCVLSTTPPYSPVCQCRPEETALIMEGYTSMVCAPNLVCKETSDCPTILPPGSHALVTCPTNPKIPPEDRGCETTCTNDADCSSTPGSGRAFCGVTPGMAYGSCMYNLEKTSAQNATSTTPLAKNALTPLQRLRASTKEMRAKYASKYGAMQTSLDGKPIGAVGSEAATQA